MNFYGKNKYHNVRTNIAGVTFDSKKEANRFIELQMLQKANVIKDLKRQVKFQIIPKTTTERAAYYVADFVYFDSKKQKTIIEDVKSAITKKNPVYILKRKLIKYLYPDYIFLEV